MHSSHRHRTRLRHQDPQLITTSATGAATWSLTWPALPAGTAVYTQAWVLDATAPASFAASCGLVTFG